MNVNSENSSFQDVILELVRQKLNMMLTEIFQLKKNVDSNNYSKLTKVILKEIANGHITSCHMSEECAKKTIHILEMLDAKKVILLDPGEKKVYNPFHDNFIDSGF